MENPLQDVLDVTEEIIRRLTHLVGLLSQRIITLDKRLSEVERLLNSRQQED